MDTEQRMQSAFYELATALLSLFEVYKAPPELINHTAEEVERIFHRHLPSFSRANDGTRGKLILERLLDELEAEGLD